MKAEFGKVTTEGGVKPPKTLVNMVKKLDAFFGHVDCYYADGEANIFFRSAEVQDGCRPAMYVLTLLKDRGKEEKWSVVSLYPGIPLWAFLRNHCKLDMSQIEHR